jgi:hypothetical protein
VFNSGAFSLYASLASHVNSQFDTARNPHARGGNLHTCARHWRVKLRPNLRERQPLRPQLGYLLPALFVS